MRRSSPLSKRLTRSLLTGFGLLCMLLGFVGAFVPLMPSTVFLIVAAWCFARSNPALHRWLRHHPVVGRPLCDWQAGYGLSARAKVAAVASITLTFSLSIGLVVQRPLAKLSLALFALGLITYLLRQPTSRPFRVGKARR